MILSEVKNKLAQLETLRFRLPGGQLVPGHFHVTEIGAINRRFIDCGGTLREENVVNFQLWEGPDRDHRLAATKLREIIALSQEKLGLGDHKVEVEYQGDTIGRYGLTFDGADFYLEPLSTDCLAKEQCGLPVEKTKRSLASLTENSCVPGSGCCS